MLPVYRIRLILNNIVIVCLFGPARASGFDLQVRDDANVDILTRQQVKDLHLDSAGTNPDLVPLDLADDLAVFILR